MCGVARAALVREAPVLILPLKIHAPRWEKKPLEDLQASLAFWLKREGLRVLPEEKAREVLGRVPSEPTEKEVRKLCQELGLKAVVWGSATVFAGKVSLDLTMADCEGEYTRRLYVTGSLDDLASFKEEAGKRLARAVLAQELVAEVRVKGNVRMDEEAILAVTSLKPGDPFDPRKLREDLKAIFKLGYFDDVRADVEEGPEGLVVTYIVREKPVVKRIVYEGNKAIKEGDLQKITELKPYTILNLNKINEAAEKIELLYRERGYYDAKVEPVVKMLNPREAKVIFKIKEGNKAYIKKIEFEGNKAFSDKELKKLLEISEKTSLSWVKKIKTYVTGGVEPGTYSYGGLYRSLGKIVTYYQNHGYIDVRVGEPRIKRQGEWIYITIPIEEGPRYRIGRIDIKQDLFKDKNFLLKQLELPKKKYFNREALRRDIMKLTDLFADKGYAYAKVEPVIKKDEKNHVVDITFVVDKGPLVYVNRIEITGNTRTRDKVIRRELLVVEQRPFSASRLKKSEGRLRRLGYFDDVSISTEKGVKEDQMDIHVKVKERPTGSFSIGAGYSSVDKVILMGEISQRNLFGKGQILSFQGLFGARTTRYSLSFTEPYFRDSRLSLGLNLYDWEREYDDYTRNSQGFGIRFGYLLTPNTRVFFGYRYDDSDLTDYYYYTSEIIRESADIHITSSIELGFNRDTRNHFFDPTRGTNLNVVYEHAGGFLGGDSAFEKITATGSVYFPTVGDFVGHVRVGVGYVTEGKGGKLPVYEKFYLGGIDSVRGYRFGDISPKDPKTGERIGGERMAFVQAEAIFPLVKSMGLKGVVFFDMGNVWGEDVGYRFSDVRKSVGLGIRWLSPMGPLRIEWGYNIDAQSDEDKSNWNFRMGGQF
ncbi:MAG: outer membrane protein assembly factor BamA [Thermodesulfobacteria bacterium]|nr:outer membrane protein assembly factor BamA [Thermodesulfobacteriota bacterium]